MDEVCGYANRPVAFVASYVKSRLLAHAAIGGAVVAAVACSVGAQYGIKVLVDSLAGGVDHGARYVWLITCYGASPAGSPVSPSSALPAISAATYSATSPGTRRAILPTACLGP